MHRATVLVDDGSRERRTWNEDHGLFDHAVRIVAGVQQDALRCVAIGGDLEVHGAELHALARGLAAVVGERFVVVELDASIRDGPACSVDHRDVGGRARFELDLGGLAVRGERW